VRVSLEEEEAPVYYGDDESYNSAEKSSQEEIALDFVEKVLTGIGVRSAITSYTEDDTVYIDVSGKDVGALIGRHGETLDAIQYLANIVMNRKMDAHYRLVLDIGGYRKRREETLVSLAKRTAGKVLKVGKSYEMEPMNAAERRIIHFALQDFQGVTTFSEGEEPERCVIISPVKE
jgi:spoIIIJ-associated protein